MKCLYLGELAARSRKNGAEGTAVHYTSTKERKSFGLSLRSVLRLYSRFSIPDVLLKNVYASSTKQQKIMLHHPMSSSVFLTWRLHLALHWLQNALGNPSLSLTFSNFSEGFL